MQRLEWSRQTSDDEAQRRAGGRKRYNAMRAFRADARRVVVAHVLRDAPSTPIGELARCLGVHRVTIWRDLRHMERHSRTDPVLLALARSALGKQGSMT